MNSPPARLIDSLISLKPQHDDASARMIRAAQRVVKAAQVFHLSDTVAQAAASVATSRPSSIEAAFDRVRLPFPITYLEWTPPTSCSRAPARIGCIFEELDHPRMLLASLIWLHAPRDRRQGELITVGVIATRIDCRPEPETSPQFDEQSVDPIIASARRRGDAEWARDDAERAALAQLSKRLTYASSPIGLPGWKLLTTPGKTPRGLDLVDLARFHLTAAQNETSYAIAALLLLNSRSCTTVEPGPDMVAINRSRARQGKRPLMAYSTVDIDLTRTMRNRGKAAGLSAAEMRAHLVRGHFKLRKTGVFWWSAHPRGVARAGFVQREGYTVRQDGS